MRSPAHCRIRAESDDGRVIAIAPELIVPVGASRIDPSLGDDPNRARTAEAWLPPGNWQLVVVVGDRVARTDVRVPDASWAIVWVGPDRVDVHPRSSRIVLE